VKVSLGSSLPDHAASRGFLLMSSSSGVSDIGWTKFMRFPNWILH